MDNTELAKRMFTLYHEGRSWVEIANDATLFVLKAIEEPSEKMVKAGSIACDNLCHMGGGFQGDIWKAMLRALSQDIESGK